MLCATHARLCAATHARLLKHSCHSCQAATYARLCVSVLCAATHARLCAATHARLLTHSLLQNAYTSSDETCYQLVVPTDKPHLLADALKVMAQFAFHIRCVC